MYEKAKELGRMKIKFVKRTTNTVREMICELVENSEEYYNEKRLLLVKEDGQFRTIATENILEMEKA